MSADLNSLLAPNDDKLFEQLCQHVLQSRCKTLGGQAYGRNGQTQLGVDFYIEVPAYNDAGISVKAQIIGVQCKHKDRLYEGELSNSEVEAEVKKARGFQPALTTFIIATSAPTNTKLQDKARELTNEHQKQKTALFSVEIWFWEKIRDEFCKNRNLLHEILERFYPNLLKGKPSKFNNLHQLPPKPAHFIGRDEDLAELEKELGASQIIGAAISGVRTKIQGAPGVGKTALAIVLAHKLKDRYPDAQLYLNLRGAGADIHGQHGPLIKPVTPAEAMQSIIHAFYPKEKLPQDLEKLSVKYNSILNDAGRVLLLLDNATDAAQIQPLLPPDNCLLLVTSRSQFSLSGLILHSIDCLRPEMSQKLLFDLAPRIERYKEEAAELCGHLPLALKVFAGVINDKNLYPVADLLRRIRERQKNLPLVDAAFFVSYELLTDSLRRWWTLLAVFPSSFSLTAAAAVWDVKQDEAREVMQILVNGSLVEWSEIDDRFRLHDLARQFCDGMLDGSEQIAARLRYSIHYRYVGAAADKLYTEGGGNLLRGLELFDCERANLEAAFEWLLIQKDEESIKNLVFIVGEVHHTSSLRFHPNQNLRWLEAQLNATRLSKNYAAEGTTLGNLGLIWMDLGDTRKAIKFYEQSLEIARKVKDKRGKGANLCNLGLAYAALGNLHKAIEYYEQSLVIAQSIGDKRGRGAILNNLGIAYSTLGETQKAIEIYEQRLKLAREMGDFRGEAYSLGNMAIAYRQTGNPYQAILLFEKALVIQRTIGDRRGEGAVFGGLGTTYSGLGDARKAFEHHERHYLIAREVGDRRGEAHGLWNSAVALDILGNRTQAIVRGQTALLIFEAIEDPYITKVRTELAKWRKS